ncbi:phage holin family protein [Mesorhizobium sp.]|uniref:phage holin family protein n=1 Tax=Mesorhizobium sp. TaxID=1871066 RepID=UPI000FE461A5|nr:phage holin family protein [Mesorhizobium sp.]RWO80376.1 MAG: phage holin family protein [Mesorhizobium sp.]RWP09691.1 MAG: phage holin family protein [Mesorhizobium sp.]RWP86060.1 MAG: phage holin family protein [Mesorhizobium sp.]RWP92856.1 MAG: phage holin family protein [Mesorhizobium sp.]RWQ14372.1 MAG: phage holin family protein [Mesorhizobium sp.]
MNTQDNPSLTGLITDLAQNVTTLVQTEARLFRAELSEKLTKAGAGAAEVLGGAICLLAALLVLLQALVIALTRAGLGAGWSSLLVGVVVAVLGVILLRTGMASMAPSELTPDRTQEQLKRDASVIKEQVR